MAFSVVLAALAAIGLYTIVKLISVLAVAWDRRLAKIPNAHWTAPYSRIWLQWQKGHGREFTYRQEAHLKHGPVVRFGPSEISVNCIEGGIKTAWGSWDKAGFYASFEYLGQHPMFATVEAKPHSVRKKMLASVYTKSYIDTSPDLANIMRVVNDDRMLPILRQKAAENTEVDALFLSTSYFMDTTTAYLYGLHNSSNFIQNPEEARVYLKAFERSLGPDTYWLMEFPLIAILAGKIGINLIPPEIWQCFPVYEGFGLNLSKKTGQSLSDDAKPETKGPSSLPIVYCHFKEKLQQAKMAEDTLDNLITAELLDHLHAAHEASGIQITYLLWELSRNPAIQEKLISEIKTLRAAGKAPETSTLLEDIFLETMRIHPPAFGPFPRTTPVQGGQIGGYDIPGGVEVGASPYTLGRNADVFPNPEEWDPRRWTNATTEARKEMTQWVWVFGSGARVCIGRYLAELTMRRMVVAIYGEFRTELGKTSDMTPTQAMMATPKGGELMLRFKTLKG